LMKHESLELHRLSDNQGDRSIQTYAQPETDLLLYDNHISLATDSHKAPIVTNNGTSDVTSHHTKTNVNATKPAQQSSHVGTIISIRRLSRS